MRFARASNSTGQSSAMEWLGISSGSSVIREFSSHSMKMKGNEWLTLMRMKHLPLVSVSTLRLEAEVVAARSVCEFGK